MNLDEAIQHCEEVAISKTKQVENGDWEKGSSTERDCIVCAEEHRQLAEWLKELKVYRDARAEIAEAFNDDARGEQNDYERGRKSGIFLCESIISVKLGESRSEIPNKSEIPTSCGDAISRQAVIDAFWKLNVELSPTAIWTIQNMVKDVPPITPQTPQQRTGRWIDSHIPESTLCECSECGFTCGAYSFNYCPNCGAKMEVEEEINDVNDDDINTMRILFNALINDLCNQCRHNDAEEMEGIRDRLIKRLLEQEPEWIPVSERLPEKATRVLTSWVYVPTGAKYIECAERYGDDDDDYTFYGDTDEYKMNRKEHKVIAWMPLVEPYKEVQE